jgi:hypothetical protein
MKVRVYSSGWRRQFTDTSTAAKEKEDITSLLDSLNLSASNNRAFSLSAESQNLVQKFTVILKDLVNGVPTAYDDLVTLLDESSETLQKNYKHLPSYLQKLIKTLPAKVSGNLGPEILATAAAAAGGADGGKTAKPGKSAMRIPSLKELVTKPGAVVGILKAIMNFLKLRWPAFLGTNVLLSLGLFGKLSCLAFMALHLHALTMGYSASFCPVVLP